MQSKNKKLASCKIVYDAMAAVVLDISVAIVIQYKLYVKAILYRIE